MIAAILILLGAVFLFTGTGATLFFIICAGLLLSDSLLWLVFWVRNRRRGASNALLFENILKALLGVALLFNGVETTKIIVMLFGGLLFLSTIFKMWSIKKYSNMLAPNVVRFSVYGNLLFVLIALIFISAPYIILGMLNGLVSLIFIGSGITMWFLKR